MSSLESIHRVSHRKVGPMLSSEDLRNHCPYKSPHRGSGMGFWKVQTIRQLWGFSEVSSMAGGGAGAGRKTKEKLKAKLLFGDGITSLKVLCL